jgi:hypothetical protein
MMGKKISSPMRTSEGHTGDNMVPKPKSGEGIDVPQKHRGPHISAGTKPAPGCGSLGRPQYCSATPDMKGTLFGHKRNPDGV